MKEAVLHRAWPLMKTLSASSDPSGNGFVILEETDFECD